jgi:hypothetical protein
MIDKKEKRYIRTKYGDANFLYVEEFDSVEKAAEPLNKGKFVEVVVKEYKWDQSEGAWFEIYNFGCGDGDWGEICSF